MRNTKNIHKYQMFIYSDRNGKEKKIIIFTHQWLCQNL